MKKLLVLLGAGLLTLNIYAAENTMSQPHKSANATTGVSMQEALSVAEKAGYKNIKEIDKKADYYKVEAVGPDGKDVDIQIDMTGKITKVDKEMF